MPSCILPMCVGPISEKRTCMRRSLIIRAGKEGLERPGNKWRDRQSNQSNEPKRSSQSNNGSYWSKGSMSQNRGYLYNPFDSLNDMTFASILTNTFDIYR